MGRPLPLTTLIVLAVFAVTGGIVWLAYGETGHLQGEPPLIQASPTPLKRAPDDPGGREVAALGGVGELLADEADALASEQLMPGPEQPLSPAEAAMASLTRGDPSADAGAASDPVQRDQASAAIKQLVDELRSDGIVSPAGAGGPAGTANDWQPSPSRPNSRDQAQGSGILQQPGDGGDRASDDADGSLTQQPAGFQVATTGEVAEIGDAARFQGSPGGRFRVQLAAVREEDDARRAWSQFQEQLGSTVAGLEPFIERAETGNGIFYRVQIGSFAEGGEAEQLCLELKKQETSCFVISK